MMTEKDFETLINRIQPADGAAVERAKRRQAELAKPPGSLGKLEEISIRMAGITGSVKNTIASCRVLVFCADNGVVSEGVAVTPQSVTLAQAINMTRHMTGMSSLASYFGNGIDVVDVGIMTRFTHPGIADRKVLPGTGNIRRGPAMTREEALRAIAVGLERAEKAKLEGMDIIGVGEMGIGNTTTSAAVLAALTGLALEEVTGRGAGLTDAAFELKKQVIADALRVNSPDGNDVTDVIAKVGGLDIAAMTGAFIGAAKNRMPAVVDGFISIVAALCAVRLCPAVRDYIFLSHASRERGYMAAAEAIGLAPFLLLDMRLGEGSGCPIAFEVIKAACAVMRDMATFGEAAIDDGYLDEIRKRR
jgi:nicotinate-nucleotide--dimethylbenzimidazole phosphoribosyltransferase